ncbi:MAG TPA: four helix bundle protein [Cyclobacteriaceae bacterium]|nr:four helix bundle protein [Cyclobacteriaceae bacterium]
MHNYKELKVWKRSIALNVHIYEITKSYPFEERYGLISQMRRSAVSIPSNIAEGGGRRTDKDFAHFLSFAHGSICELESQLYISLELKFISQEDFDKIASELTEIQKMLYSLIVKFSS